MHYRRYIIRDGVPVLPDTTSGTHIMMYTYLNGERVNITKNTHDILDFGYIIEPYDTTTVVLNDFAIKCFVRVRDKSTNKIYEGESTGYHMLYTMTGLWPNISEV